MRGNGERIGPQNLPTSSIAGGIWNLLNQQRAQQRGAWPSATPAVTTDPYFMYVPLLLNTTSTNAQQNNTFLDSSTNNFTITRNGTPTQGSFTPYQPNGYWSGYFNGSTDQLTAGSNAAFAFGSGAYTVEFWTYLTTAVSASHNPCFVFNDTTNGFGLWNENGANQLQIGSRNGVVILSSTTTLAANTWNHVVAVRSGTGTNQTSLFVNGTRVANGTDSTNWTITGPLKLGGISLSNYYVTGYLSNVRVVKGTAVYDPTQTTITVPTTPITAITNTSLLTLQSNRFIDNSTNNFAITANGTPKVQAFQPFAPAASYDAATYGGSGYFNASSSYLSIATPTATNISANTNFTIEGWIYPIAHTNTAPCIFNNYTNSGLSGVLALFAGHNAFGSTTYNINLNGTIVNGGTIVYNQWSHFAIVRNGTGSSNVVLYINGVSVGTSTSNAALSYNGGLFLGTAGDSTANSSFNGYISNFRWNNSTAIYTAAFTPPTTPLTAVSGTSLLTNFTNAGIYDAAWQNNALTVGDAQASTTITAKWPPTSMKFDGTGDYLTMPLNAGTTITSGNFTVEFWLYPSTVATATQAIIGTTEGDTAGTINWMTYLVSSSLYFQCYSNSSTLMVQFNHQTTLSAGNWYYCAVTRSGSTFTLYLNGVASTSTPTSSATINQSGSTLYVGKFGASSSIGALNGYIQDLRITKGVARTITTPTAAFPTR